MIYFWNFLAAYVVFAVAILIGYPKHIRMIILDAPEEETTGVDTLLVLLIVAAIMTALEVAKLVVN